MTYGCLNCEATIEIDGVKFVTLEKLIELKLASGITAPDRLKDLADVQELIKVTRSPFGKLIREKLTEVRFVPLIGEEGWGNA